MVEPDTAKESTSLSLVSSLPLPDGKDYHAFICFNIADQQWVDELLVYLESQEIGIKCVDHRRDFHAGKTTVRNIEKFIEKSWKYVLVMSPEFVVSDWCRFETDIMVNMSLEQRQECIIPVLLKPCTIPKSLKAFTYIDACNSSNWRDRLVRDIRRTDISSEPIQYIERELMARKQNILQNVSSFQQYIDNYKNEKRRLEMEKMSLEHDVLSVFSMQSKQLLEELERQKAKTLNDIGVYIDKRLASLVQRLEIAKQITASANKDLEGEDLKSFSASLDEYEKLERKQKETSYTEFVASKCLLEKLAQLDVGYLKEVDITQIKSEEKEEFIKEMAPSSAIIPREGIITPQSLVKCPYFHFDSETVWEGCSIQPDGSLSNHRPSEPHPKSDRRLKKFCGAIGSTRFTSGKVYYWENKIDANIEKALGKLCMVFEVGLSTRGVIDEKFDITKLEGTLTCYMNMCKEHEDKHCLCLKVRKNRPRNDPHAILFQNRTGKWPSLVFGFLLDTVRQRWTIYDVIKEKLITTVEEIQDVGEFTPMFGVYSHSLGSVSMSLITGKDLEVSDEMYQLIEKALE